MGMNEMTVPGLTIVPCRPADAEALSAIAKRTFYDTFTGTCSEEDMQGFLYEYYDAARLRRELETGVLPSWFAMADGLPAGYVSFAQRPPAFPYNGDAAKAFELIRLYVDKPFHGKGVAQALMRFYMDAAVAEGAACLWLGVWEHNYRAQKFYSKYGFTFTGHTHPFPIGLTPQIDQWWAKKVVSH